MRLAEAFWPSKWGKYPCRWVEARSERTAVEAECGRTLYAQILLDVDSFEFGMQNFKSRRQTCENSIFFFFCCLADLWQHRLAVEYFKQHFKFGSSDFHARFDHLFRSWRISNEVDALLKSLVADTALCYAYLHGLVQLTYSLRPPHTYTHTNTHTATDT